MKVLFIGGPGNLSAWTLEALQARGEAVGLFTHPRSAEAAPPDMRVFPGDRNDIAALGAALDAFRPDVVLDFVCFTPDQARAVASLVRDRVAQFVFVSTVDVYGYPLSRLPFAESDPWGPPNCDYATLKRKCEDIFAAEGQARLPLTIVRPAYSFGRPFVLTAMSRSQGRHMITRLRHGMPVLSPGDGTTLIHAGSAYNTGRMIASVVGSPVALGRDYTVGHRSFVSYDGYVGLFASVLGVKPEIVHIPTDVILSIPGPDTDDSLLRVLTGFNVGFSVERFHRDFPDFAWTMSLEDWARDFVTWNDARSRFPGPEVAIFDDRLIAAWRRCLGGLRLE